MWYFDILQIVTFFAVNVACVCVHAGYIGSSGTSGYGFADKQSYAGYNQVAVPVTPVGSYYVRNISFKNNKNLALTES